MPSNKEFQLISVCSPIYNEEGNLPFFVERVCEIMDKHFKDKWEQVLVDDGSTDSSIKIIEKLQETHNNISLYKHEKNFGERSAWQTAFLNARGDIVVMLASDLQSPPEEIPNLIQLILEEGVDVGTALRKNRKDGLYYWTSTRILNIIMRVVFGLNVKDASSSFFAVKKMFIKDLNLYENDHRYILSIFKKRGAKIIEIPTKHNPRIFGKSKYGKMKVIFAFPEIIRFSARFFKGVYDYKKN